MKKLLGIIVLSLLLSGNVYANCRDKIDASWKWDEIFEGKKDMWWTFKNTSDMNIVITKIGLKSKDGSTMYEEKPWPKAYGVGDGYPVGDEDFYLKPFGVSKKTLSVWYLNLDVAGKGYYSCKYGRKPVKTNQTNKSSSSNSSSNSSKSKQQSETSGSSKSLLKKLLGKN
tara:strand:- start:465 stop:974 length:510 start_codon:yes stop_codon:yes gene_type:complete